MKKTLLLLFFSFLLAFGANGSTLQQTIEETAKQIQKDYNSPKYAHLDIEEKYVAFANYFAGLVVDDEKKEFTETIAAIFNNPGDEEAFSFFVEDLKEFSNGKKADPKKLKELKAFTDKMGTVLNAELKQLNQKISEQQKSIAKKEAKIAKAKSKLAMLEKELATSEKELKRTCNIRKRTCNIRKRTCNIRKRTCNIRKRLKKAKRRSQTFKTTHQRVEW